jgi:hypothetical protein
MGNRITNHVQGFAVVDSRWKAANLRTNDAASGNSDYTEASPQPGQMELEADGNQGRLEISGGQSTTFYGKAALGGDAAFDSAGIAYRIDGETSDKDWRGWNPPNFPQYWSGLTSASIAGIGLKIAIVKRTQQPWIVAGNSIYYWDPSVLGAYNGWAFAGGGPQGWSGQRALGIAEYNGTLYAVNPGPLGIETWTATDADFVFSKAFEAPDNSGGGLGARGKGDLAIDDRKQMLYLCEYGTSVHQWASQNFGATWSYIGSLAVPTLGSVSPVPGGGFLVGLVGSILMTTRVLPDAFTPLDDVDATTPHGSHLATDDAFAAWADYDGAFFSLSDTSTGGIELAVSTDGGATWAATDSGLADFNTTADKLTDFSVVPYQGGALLLHEWKANVSATVASGVWQIGGWAKVEAPVDTGAASLSEGRIRNTFGFGENSNFSWTSTWLPIELPSNMGAGWTSVGTAGTLTAGVWTTNGSPVNMEWNLTSGSGTYQNGTLPAGAATVTCGQFNVISGGSTSSGDIGFGSRWADGASDYRVRIYASSAQFSVYDFHGATALATVNISNWSSNSVQILMYHDQADVQVWYRLPGFDTEWTHVVTSSALTDGGALAATSLIYFGHLATSTSRSIWQGFYSAADAADLEPFRSGLSPTLGNRIRGRWLTVEPIPVPNVGTSTDHAFASMVRGPALRDEVMTIEPSHRYPVESVFPLDSASPSDEWRSTSDASDVRLSVDFTRDTALDGSWALALGLVNTNLTACKLEGWDGSAWTTLGTYNGATGFSGLTYQLTGDVIRPDAATADAGRFLQAGEMVGGYAILDPAGTPKVRKIAYHTGGSWSGDTTARPFIRLEGIDGTELATGTVKLVAPSGCLFVYLSGAASTHYERFSLLIEASANETAEGYFKIGAAPLGAVTAVGQRWGRGWSRAHEPNVSSYGTEYGTTRRRQDGPNARRWSMSWQTGLNVRQLRQGLDNNYVSPNGTAQPLAADQDVWWQLVSVFEQAKGGEIPVIACARLPTSSGTTLTDPTAWLYGTLSGTVQANNVVGDELDGEAMRVESITVEEQL